jgi:starch synthase
MAGKLACRSALQHELGLDTDDGALVVAIVSRLTAQKGLDLVLAALPELLCSGIQFVVQGTGDPALETAFRIAAQAHPGRLHVHIGYDEARAHRVMAGADVIAVPSRFEPCGLTQMYGLRYGTLPVVRRVGGLADTVRDAGGPGGNGFVFDAATPEALMGALRAAQRARADAGRWTGLQRVAMAEPLSWAGPAREYLALYEQAARGSR